MIRLGALLHDIGKIGVPDAVLLKPTALTPAEFDIIKQHPGAGARILQSVPFLAPAHSDRRAASRAAGRTRLSAWPARRRDPDRRAHRARGRRVRRHDERPRLPRRAAVRPKRCRSCGALRARGSTPKRSARWRRCCRASSPTRAKSCSRACMRSAGGCCWLLRRLALAGSAVPAARADAVRARQPRHDRRRRSVPRRQRLGSSADHRRHHRHRAAGRPVADLRAAVVPAAAPVAADRAGAAVGRAALPGEPALRTPRSRSPRAWTPATSRRRSASACSTRTRERIRRSPGTRATSRRCCPSTRAARACRPSPRRIRSAPCSRCRRRDWDARAAVVNSAPVRSFDPRRRDQSARDAGLRSRRRHHADDRPSPRRVVRARRVSHGRTS